MANKYLYGASVQGIQEFIFSTNKLREVVGASEIVEYVCNELFYEIVERESTPNEYEVMMLAAGNIKVIFSNVEMAKKVFQEFPYLVNEKGPGLKVSQVLIEFEEKSSPPIDQLEDQLKLKKSLYSFQGGQRFMGINYSRRTGNAGVLYSDGEVVDAATKTKVEKAAEIKMFEKFLNPGEIARNSEDVPYDLKKLSAGGHNSWIAIVHADANGLGNILQNYGQKLVENGEFANFSSAIQNATVGAAKLAFEKVIKPLKKAKNVYPFRPIICAGDDFTAIIRGDLAVSFTSEFLKQFEVLSAKELASNLPRTKIPGGLTSCAGIAFVKDTYPFHLGVKLAEDLCSNAKKYVKSNKSSDNSIKSALAFHKQQDSLVIDFETMLKSVYRKGNLFNYYDGPFTLDSLDKLIYKVNSYHKLVSEGKASTSKVREILDESVVDIANTELLIRRIKTTNTEAYELFEFDCMETVLRKGGSSVSSLMSIITLENLIYG